MTLPTWLHSRRPALAAAALLILATACVGYLPLPGIDVVWVRVGPPAPRHEVIVARPGPDFIWITGYYRWETGVYAWVPGRWERRPHARAVWVEGRWYHERRGWYWLEGHWEERR